MPCPRPVLLVPLLCGALAACSSGGGGSDALDSFADIEAYGSDLEDVIDTLDFTDPATLPAGGTARYAGVIGLDVEDIENLEGESFDVAGELSLVAGFDDDSIDGTATNFYTPDEEDIDGTLHIDFGDLYRDADTSVEYTFDAVLRGTLENESGDLLDIDGTLLGDFYGPNWSHVAGEVEGEGCLGASCSELDGDFVGERD